MVAYVGREVLLESRELREEFWSCWEVGQVGVRSYKDGALGARAGRSGYKKAELPAGRVALLQGNGRH